MKKTALVTGASAGLGVEFANQLAARGYDLLLVARRMERLKEQARVIGERHGVEVSFFASDLSEPAAPAAIERFASERGIAVDYLVNNAGSAGPDLLDDRDWEAQAAFFELMMTSVAQMCHRFVPPMRERGFGRVINVSSFAGRLPRRPSCAKASRPRRRAATSTSPGGSTAGSIPSPNPSGPVP